MELFNDCESKVLIDLVKEIKEMSNEEYNKLFNEVKEKYDDFEEVVKKYEEED